MKTQATSFKRSVKSDERAIRAVVSTWLEATKKGDLATVLRLMSDDVVFIVPGRKPFGKKAFIAQSRKMQGMRFKGTSDIRELKVLGDWAWMHNHLRITLTPPGGKPMHRSGHTLTLLRRKPNGSWVITRDANLVG